VSLIGADRHHARSTAGSPWATGSKRQTRGDPGTQSLRDSKTRSRPGCRWRDAHGFPEWDSMVPWAPIPALTRADCGLRSPRWPRPQPGRRGRHRHTRARDPLPLEPGPGRRTVPHVRWDGHDDLPGIDQVHVGCRRLHAAGRRQRLANDRFEFDCPPLHARVGADPWARGSVRRHAGPNSYLHPRSCRHWQSDADCHACQDGFARAQTYRHPKTDPHTDSRPDPSTGAERLGDRGQRQLQLGWPAGALAQL
jgi:hypothetical protein